MESHVRRNILLGLGGVTALALLAALVVVLTAPDSALGWLVACLVIIVAAIAAEIVVIVRGSHETRADLAHDPRRI